MAMAPPWEDRGNYNPNMYTSGAARTATGMQIMQDHAKRLMYERMMELMQIGPKTLNYDWMKGCLDPAPVKPQQNKTLLLL